VWHEYPFPHYKVSNLGPQDTEFLSLGPVYKENSDGSE